MLLLWYGFRGGQNRFDGLVVRQGLAADILIAKRCGTHDCQAAGVRRSGWAGSPTTDRRRPNRISSVCTGLPSAGRECIALRHCVQHTGHGSIFAWFEHGRSMRRRNLQPAGRPAGRPCKPVSSGVYKAPNGLAATLGLQAAYEVRHTGDNAAILASHQVLVLYVDAELASLVRTKACHLHPPPCKARSRGALHIDHLACTAQAWGPWSDLALLNCAY